MKILLTGASGFLGQTIKEVLSNNEIVSVGRTNADIITDLARDIPVLPHCDVIIHAAGKAHTIPKTNAEEKDFFDVNLKGTSNLIKALENSILPKAFVFISTVAVYGLEKGNLITETHPLLATSPYGRSKIEAEQLILKWCEENKVIPTIFRLPLVVGSNPLGNLKQMIDGIRSRYYFNINSGQAKKSMVFAEDVARIIPLAAEIGGIYNLTDGYNPNFLEVSKLIARQLNRPYPLNIPLWLAQPMAKIGDIINPKMCASKKLAKMISNLTFDDSKARQYLDWTPVSIIDNFKIK